MIEGRIKEVSTVYVNRIKTIEKASQINCFLPQLEKGSLFILFIRTLCKGKVYIL